MSNWWDADGPGEKSKGFWLTDAPVDKGARWKKVGARMTAPEKALLSAIQGPTFGFGDEIVGGLGALATRVLPGAGSNMPVGEAYNALRDIARGAQASFESDHPALAMGSQIAASLPYGGPLARVNRALPASTGAIPRAIAMGAAGGALSGAGASENTNNLLTDSILGAAGGAVMGGAAQGVTSSGSAMLNALAPRFSKKSAEDVAHNRIAEALARDRKTTDQVQARLDKLGPEARIADAGGSNTLDLLDTVATLPGATANRTETAIRERQAGRSSRLAGSAEEGLGVQGRRLPGTLADLDAARREAAGPLYARIRTMQIPVDDELRTLLERAKPAFADAKRLAGVAGQKFELEGIGPTAPLSQVDTLKRSLYDLEQAQINPDTGRLNEMGRAYQQLRRNLVSKLDTATVEDGQSIYKAARDAYAGPSELRNAANLGAQAMSKDAWKVAELTDGLSASELDAFRVGAMEAIRKKVGTVAGQGGLMRMWREPATAEKLREIFPNERSFREFASSVAAEARMQGMDRVGRGSQTASREARMDDLNGGAMKDFGAAVSAAKTGNAGVLAAKVRELYGRAATPEPVRDAIGEILLTRAPDAPQQLNRLALLIDSELRKRSAQSRASSVVGVNALQQMLGGQ